MTVGSKSQGLEGPRNRNVSTLEVAGAHPRRGLPQEGIRSIPVAQRDLKRVFELGPKQRARQATQFHKKYQGEAVRKAVGRLLGARTIRELLFPNWLDNTTLIPKPNRAWRLWADLISNNMAQPKDGYPLLNIYRLDSSQLYHQVFVVRGNGKKTYQRATGRDMRRLFPSMGIVRRRNTEMTTEYICSLQTLKEGLHVPQLGERSDVEDVKMLYYSDKPGSA
ncbi:hypothetical protein LIER_13769 [Lithospermum erythrorhizon]|uniref:Uncharacterized protein n=1 Tax=Lithospermum erythrorhizon TaxID=34254 RepID=A0AAV3PWL3_LITER